MSLCPLCNVARIFASNPKNCILKENLPESCQILCKSTLISSFVWRYVPVLLPEIGCQVYLKPLLARLQAHQALAECFDTHLKWLLYEPSH
jgi:hypothetical protein